MQPVSPSKCHIILIQLIANPYIKLFFAKLTGPVKDNLKYGQAHILSMARLKNSDVVNALKGCVDPEIGINIVDLGLIHGIAIDEQNNITLRLTMTSPMCPVTSVILADAQLRLEHLPEVGKVDLDLVWDPAWTPEMITEEVRMGMQV
jgi:metal-sulfur cluster biosynthetic enzyme